MPRFIKYTSTKKVAEEDRHSFIYVNVDYLAQAVWNDKASTLQLLMLIPLPNGKESRIVNLEGEEAKEAMQIIRDLP